MCNTPTKLTKAGHLLVLAKASRRRAILHKALNPLVDRDFIALVQTLSVSLQRVAGPVTKEVVREAFDKLDVDWNSLNSSAISKLAEATNKAIRTIPGKIIPELELKVSTHSKRMVLSSKRNLGKRYKVKVGADFTSTDAKTVSAIKKIGVFVKDRYGNRADAIQTQIENVVSDGLAKGLRSSEITKELKKIGADNGVVQTSIYWTTVANNAMNMSRVYGLLSGMTQAGIEQYEFSAVMDERTTPICRFLDGKVFTVSSGMDRFSELRSRTSEDPEAVTTVMPFVKERRNADGELELRVTVGTTDRRIATVTRDARGNKDDRGSFSNTVANPTLSRWGITLPPLHHLCRSTVLPVV